MVPRTRVTWNPTRTLTRCCGSAELRMVWSRNSNWRNGSQLYITECKCGWSLSKPLISSIASEWPWNRVLTELMFTESSSVEVWASVWPSWTNCIVFCELMKMKVVLFWRKKKTQLKIRPKIHPRWYSLSAHAVWLSATRRAFKAWKYWLEQV